MNDDDDRRDVDADRRSDRFVNRRGDPFFPDFFDPFAPTKSLSQMLNFMDQITDRGGRRYSSRIELPQNVYKVDEIKAEMTNGVLKVRVPKVKEEERKDVFQVKIE
nr:PREDICTED: heat shock 22 kDa protein, mitochondrial-like [Daucus carota subsp. sativus]